MCIICVSPPGSTFRADDLREAIRENKDGAGYMIRHRGSLLIDRSAKDAGRIVEWLIANQDAYKGDWVVFHARLATHGSVVDENTHPFNVPGKHWALAHNGVCGLKDGPFTDRSDSRILAEDHVSGQTWAGLRESQKDVEKWLSLDKVVLLSARREKGGPCLIFNRELGVDNKDGTWYSHRLYWPHASTVTAYSGTTAPRQGTGSVTHYTSNATATGAPDRRHSGSGVRERKPFRAKGTEGSDWYGTYSLVDGVYRYTARYNSEGRLEPISGVTPAGSLSDSETDSEDDRLDAIDAMTKDELLARAAVELGVTADDLTAWSYDDPELLREILKLNPDDSEDLATDPTEPESETVQPQLWEPLDPKRGWSTQGYWDKIGLWHEPDGEIWECRENEDGTVSAVVVGNGDFDPDASRLAAVARIVAVDGFWDF